MRINKNPSIMAKLFFFLLITSTPFMFAAPAVVKDSVSILTTDANSFWDDRYGDAYMNSCSFNQDSLVSYNGWQYAVYYNSNRNVVLARRKLPAGNWEKITFTDYRENSYDNHNTLVMGISPVDGRIHLSFDHHISTLHYRFSVAGLASDPSRYSWNSSQFGPIQDNLGGRSITSLTYPHFLSAPDGTFTFYARIGTSGQGDNYIWQYNNNGSWTELGKFLEGGDQNAYFHGISYDDSNRLHAAWCWRATSNGYTNHDLLYGYSDDKGRTWKNNNGSTLATTGSHPITTAMDFYIWTIPQYGGLINQEAMIVDSQNRVHVFTREDINATNYQMHYWRDTKGNWTRNNTGIKTKIWDNRSKIAYDSEGNVYGILPNIVLASASVASNYRDWAIIDDSTDGQYVHSEPLIDSSNLRLLNNELYVFAQKGTTSTTSGEINIIKYKLNDSSTPTPLPPEAYPIIYSVSSEPEPQHRGENIIDGNLDPESRWSAQGYPQNIIIDYGSAQNFSAISLYPFENRDYQYQVELSDSPTEGYQTIVNRSTNTSTSSPVRDSFPSQSGRYIRITISGATSYSGDWVSLIEFEATTEAPPTPAPEYNKGDVNHDDRINIIDSLLIAQYYVGLNPENFDPDLADINNSNKIDIVDALLIAQYYVGLINSLG